MKSQSTRVLTALLAAWLAVIACNIPTIAPQQPAAELPSQEDLAQTAAALVLTAQAPASPSPEALAAASAEAAATACQATVTANLNANVRSGPGTEFGTVGSLTQGDTAPVAGKNEDATWWYIEYAAGSDGHAWIAASVTTSSCIPEGLVVIATSSASEANEAPAAGEEPAAAAAGPMADLVITQFSIAPETPTRGEPAHVRIQTRNQGDAASGPYAVHWYGLSTYGSPSCTWSVSSSNPGGGRLLECDFAFVSKYPVDKVSLAVVDANGQVEESDEGNNEATISPFGVAAP